MTSLTNDTVAPLMDADAIALLLQDVTHAGAELAASAVVPTSTRELVRSLPVRLHAEAPTNALAGDPYLSEAAFAGAARAAAALLDPDLVEARRVARLALEQVRQALRDILEWAPVADEVPAAEIAGWLETTLSLTQVQLAQLVGVSPRTWQRWLAGAQPDAGQLVRLRRVAALSTHLRHALTGPGVAHWFFRPHPLLNHGKGTPADVLGDPDGYRRLLMLAAGLRSTQAS